MKHVDDNSLDTAPESFLCSSSKRNITSFMREEHVLIFSAPFQTPHTSIPFKRQIPAELHAACEKIKTILLIDVHDRPCQNAPLARAQQRSTSSKIDESVSHLFR
jgi:hypothetical protein